MKTLQFSTSMSCGGCLAAVKPHLDALGNVSEWKVDLEAETKTLTVSGEDIQPGEIIETVQKAGFAIEAL